MLGRILSTGLGGYAGSAARALLEHDSEIEGRVGPGAFDLWKQHFEERLSELAAALSFERPELFASGSSWAKTAYEAREASIDLFVQGLRALEAELAELLPPGSDTVIAPYFRAAHEALPAAVAGEAELGGRDRRALEFLQHTLDGQSRDAGQLLLDAHDGGISVADLFEEVVIPAQREVGNFWHRGEINVAEEHLATLTTQKAIAVLTHHVSPEPLKGKTVVVSSVTGDTHDLGLRLLAELFDLAGWRSVALGSDVPRIDLLQALDGFQADLLVLSATLARHLISVRATIEAVRQRSRTETIKVMVGGRAFGATRELWSEVGADGWAATLREAVAEGDRLVAAP